MSINFQTFLEKTGFTAPYAARKILYFPKSRPALLAVSLELDIEGQRSEMVGFVNGSKKIDSKVKTNSTFPSKEKGAGRQLDIIDQCPLSGSNANTAGEAA